MTGGNVRIASTLIIIIATIKQPGCGLPYKSDGGARRIFLK